MLDDQGRVWYTARIRAADNPAFCKKGSDHPSAQAVSDSSVPDRQLAVYDPKSGKYTFIDTCFGTHHLQFADDANDTIWTSGGGEVVGWLDTKKFDADRRCGRGAGLGAVRSRHQWQRQAATSGWSRTAARIRARDQRLAVGFYAVMPNPADGSVWGSVAFRYPGRDRRFDPRTQLSGNLQRAARPASVCAARISIATASSGSRSAAGIWVSSTAASARAAERPEGNRRSLPGRLELLSACRVRDSRTCRSSASSRATTPGSISTTRWAGRERAHRDRQSLRRRACAGRR